MRLETWRKTSFFIKSLIPNTSVAEKNISKNSVFEDKTGAENASLSAINDDFTIAQDNQSDETVNPSDQTEQLQELNDDNHVGEIFLECMEQLDEKQTETAMVNMSNVRKRINCPLCNCLLDEKTKEANAHVNLCLDQSNQKLNDDLDESVNGPDIHSGEIVSDSVHVSNSVIVLDSVIEQQTNIIHEKVIAPTTVQRPPLGRNLIDKTVTQNHEINYWKQKTDTKIQKSTNENHLNQPKSENSFGNIYSKTNRKCPFYKFIPGTPFTVDAFHYGKIPSIEGYFLTHFHADHYGGLTSKFDFAPIFCSEITGDLVIQQIRVKPHYIVKLALNQEHFINGVSVTLFDANHCPGAVLILFQVDGHRYLHTGDFRAHPDHLKIMKIQEKPLDILYLDTTYMSPSHTFPCQQQVLKLCGDLAFSLLVEKQSIHQLVGKRADKALQSSKNMLQNWLMRANSNLKASKTTNTLILVGSYTIGKERVYLEMASRTNTKIYAETAKRRIHGCLQWTQLTNRLTTDPQQSDIHVVSMSHLKEAKIQEKLSKLTKEYHQIMVVRPTGWTFKPSSNPTLTLDQLKPTFSHLKLKSKRVPVCFVGVPYSEHSSFTELESFLKGLHHWPSKIIPTVNVGSAKRIQEMNKWFCQWKSEFI